MRKSSLKASRKRMAERKMHWGMRGGSGRKYVDGMPMGGMAGNSPLTMMRAALAGLMAAPRGGSRSS